MIITDLFHHLRTAYCLVTIPLLWRWWWRWWEGLYLFMSYFLSTPEQRAGGQSPVQWVPELWAGQMWGDRAASSQHSLMSQDKTEPHNQNVSPDWPDPRVNLLPPDRPVWLCLWWVRAVLSPSLWSLHPSGPHRRHRPGHLLPEARHRHYNLPWQSIPFKPL